MGLEGAGWENRPPGRPGGPQLYCYLLHFGHFGVSGTAWAALEVCVASQDVSGELPEALWSRFGTSWGALGAFFASIF